MISSAAVRQRDTYWATEPADDLAQICCDMIAKYRNELKASTLYARYIRSFRNWHGLGDAHSGEASTIARRGAKGHRAGVRTNTAGIDARHQLGIIAPVIPALDAIPINTAYRTLVEVKESKRFFTYYVERRGLGPMLYQCGENMLKFGVSWIVTDWDVFGGPLLRPDQQDPSNPQRKHQGQLKFRCHTPLDLVLDIHQDGHHDWFMSRDKVNRWKLIEDYPALADKIRNAKSAVQDDEWSSTNFRFDGLTRDSISDLIPIWTLHHRRCSPLHEGRMFRFINEETPIFDGPYPYEELTLSEMNAGKIWNTALGDSTFHHALGIQAALDRTLSATVTNSLALGHQLVVIPDENFEIRELSDGVSAIVKGSAPHQEPPSAVNLLGPQAEHHHTVEALEKYVHAASAINSVIRGDPDTNIKSGAFAGLLVQQASQFNSPATYSFARCTEKVGNDMLDILKKFADHPIQGEISGPNNTWRMRAFTSEDYAGIHRLVVRQGDPSEDTPAFRKSKADQLLEAGLVANRQEYEAMISNNTDEISSEDNEAAELLVILENETMLALAEGKPLEEYMVAKDAPIQFQPPSSVARMPDGSAQPMLGPDGQPVPLIQCPPVVITHDPMLHVAKHADQLNSPAALGNERLVEIISVHIQWHIQVAMSRPPELAMMLKQLPPPPPPMPMAGPAANDNKEGEGKPKGPNGVQAVRPVKVPNEAQPKAGMGP